MRCSCSDCVNERDALRGVEVAEFDRSRNARDGGWAERSWNGPLANFPGHSHDDTGRPRLITHH